MVPEKLVSGSSRRRGESAFPGEWWAMCRLKIHYRVLITETLLWFWLSTATTHPGRQERRGRWLLGGASRPQSGRPEQRLSDTPPSNQYIPGMQNARKTSRKVTSPKNMGIRNAEVVTLFHAINIVRHFRQSQQTPYSNARLEFRPYQSNVCIVRLLVRLSMMHLQHNTQQHDPK
jgi:hypothetical protein